MKSSTVSRLLGKEPEKFKLTPISWTKTENASKDHLVKLLNTHYPEQAWDMVLSLLLQVNQEDLSIMAQKKRRHKRNTKKFMKNTFHFKVYGHWRPTLIYLIETTK